MVNLIWKMWLRKWCSSATSKLRFRYARDRFIITAKLRKIKTVLTPSMEPSERKKICKMCTIMHGASSFFVNFDWNFANLIHGFYGSEKERLGLFRNVRRLEKGNPKSHHSRELKINTLISMRKVKKAIDLRTLLVNN